MLSPDEFIDQLFLAHADVPYDPVKAHEYYLRTRQLKGRQPGSGIPPVIGRPPKAIAKSIVHPAKKPPKLAPKVPSKKPAVPKQSTAAQITALQSRLMTLRKVLAELVKQAKARSGVHTNSAATPQHKQTAAQKKAASEAAKKYYELHKNDKTQTPSQQLKDLQSKIAIIQEKIKKMKAEIAANDKKHPTKKVGTSPAVKHK